jgi:hypothetical protein
MLYARGSADASLRGSFEVLEPIGENPRPAALLREPDVESAG